MLQARFVEDASGHQSDRVGSTSPEIPHDGGPELQMEAHIEAVDHPQYESLRDQVCEIKCKLRRK